MDSTGNVRHSKRLKNANAATDSEVAKLVLSNNLEYVGSYSIGKTLGEGTFGKVKAGVHLITGVPVAIKIVDKIHAPSVVREVETWRQLHHPHIVQLYEVITTESKIFMIMEHCSGGEAFDFIVKNGKILEQNGHAQNIFRQLVEAVGYCHSTGFVHRDLKLENILLSKDGQVKLIDFGFTREYTQKNLLQTYCGSLAYAAPEMITGTKYSGPLADVWSLGVILYSLVCGHLPFDDQNEAVAQKQILNLEYTIPETISPLCKDLIEKILVINPQQRISLNQIAMHPWLENHSPAHVQLSFAMEPEKTFSALGRTPSFKAVSVSEMSTSNNRTSGLRDAKADESFTSSFPYSINSPSSSFNSFYSDKIKAHSALKLPNNGQMLQQHIYSFSSTEDLILITSLQTVGLDIASIMKSVSLNLCDSNSALWYLLKYKREQLRSKPTSQLHLQIQSNALITPENNLIDAGAQKLSSGPETGCIGLPKLNNIDPLNSSNSLTSQTQAIRKISSDNPTDSAIRVINGSARGEIPKETTCFELHSVDLAKLPIYPCTDNSINCEHAFDQLNRSLTNTSRNTVEENNSAAMDDIDTRMNSINLNYSTKLVLSNQSSTSDRAIEIGYNGKVVDFALAANPESVDQRKASSLTKPSLAGNIESLKATKKEEDDIFARGDLVSGFANSSNALCNSNNKNGQSSKKNSPDSFAIENCFNLDKADLSSSFKLPAVLVLSVNVSDANSMGGLNHAKETHVVPFTDTYVNASNQNSTPLYPSLGSQSSGHSRALSVARKPSHSILEEIEEKL